MQQDITYVERLIEQRRWDLLKEQITEHSAPEVAELLLDLEKSDRVLLFRPHGRPSARGSRGRAGSGA